MCRMSSLEKEKDWETAYKDLYEYTRFQEKQHIKGIIKPFIISVAMDSLMQFLL